MNLQKNTFLLTVLAACFCWVAIAVVDKPAPVEDKTVAVEPRVAPDKSVAEIDPNKAIHREMDGKVVKDGKSGPASLTRSLDNKFCVDQLCPAGKMHVGCDEQAAWYGGKCAIDAQLLTLDKELREYVIEHFNTLRNEVARGGFSGFTEASRMATMVWDKELAEVAVFNVLKCKLHRDECRNTEKFNNVGQTVGYRALYHRSETLKRSMKKTINLWFNEQGKTTMDEVLKYKMKYGKVKGNFMQIVLENSNKVGCAALRQTYNGWLQTYFTCNYAVSPVHGHPVYDIDSNVTCKTGKSTRYDALCNEDETYEAREPIFDEDDKKNGLEEGAMPLVRVFDSTDPQRPLTSEQKARLRSKFGRFMDKMMKSEQLAQGHKVVVITSNHEVEVEQGNLYR